VAPLERSEPGSGIAAHHKPRITLRSIRATLADFLVAEKQVETR
jgi:hypothetical protein